MTRRLLTAVACLALLAGACSDDDDETTTAPGAGDAPVVAGEDDPTSTTQPPPPFDPTGTGLECEVVDPDEEVTDAEALAVTAGPDAVTLQPTSIAAGWVFLQVTMVADPTLEDAEARDLLLVRADGPDDIPTVADGRVDEATLGDAVVGAFTPFPDACEGEFLLEAGRYVLVSSQYLVPPGEPLEFLAWQAAVLEVG